MVNCNPEGNCAKSGFSSGLTGLSPFPRKTHMAKEVYLSANCKSTAGGNFPGAGTQGGKTGKVKTAFHRNAVSGELTHTTYEPHRIGITGLFYSPDPAGSRIKIRA